MKKMTIIDKIHNEITHTILWFYENLRCIKYRDLILENRRFQNIANGRRCFIIGNGPSLTVEDLETIHKHNDVSFSSNKIYKLFDKTSWRPTYYATCDTKLYNNFKNEIDALDLIKFFPLDIFDKCIKERMKNVFVFSRLPFQFFGNKPRFNPNLLGRLSEGGTVTFHQLQIAVAMGFKEIYLIGIDFNFSWGIGPDGKYFENPSVKDHFDADKSKLDVMPNLYYNLQAYKAAKKYAEINNVKIYNATRGGKLEVFPRINFDSLF